jgi:S-(hydroxymethyl)glutathione dehydrogenase/alcohol dehydrogenase
LKAAVLVESGKSLELADLELPALGVGQVLVSIKYSGICGAQIGEIDAVKGVDKFLPHCLGHEAVAVVQEIGLGVKTVAINDVVILHWRPSLGIQSDPPVYLWNGRRVNAGWVTSFQEQAVVSENRVTKLPGGIDERIGPLFGCSLTTSYGVITRDANVRVGESVLVFGAGGVGLPIIMLAALAGAHPITVVDPVPAKLAAAYEHGGTPATTPDGLYDCVVDTTGRSDVIEKAYAKTKPQGRTILVGVPRHDDPITIHSLPLHFGRVLTGSHGGDSKPHEDIPLLAALVRAGKLNLSGLITHEYPLERVNEALDVMRSGAAGRILLRCAE